MDAVNGELLVSKERAAELLGVQKRSVERLLSRGVLRRVRPGGRLVRLDVAQVRRWVEAGCPGRPWQQWDR